MGASTNSNEELFRKFGPGPGGEYVFIEDDGSVAYAYLLDCNSSIIANVWLYNREFPSDTKPWNSDTTPTYVNPRPFADSNSRILRPWHGDEISVRWHQGGNSTLARIFYKKELFAVLESIEKIGWSKFALEAGPLAKPLRDWREPDVQEQ
ncbi:MAG: hypothetical protein ACKVP5_07990 [Aestuariivirga sp.]